LAAREYVVLVVATLVWGSVHPTVKFALSELSSVQLALARPVCACVVLTTLSLATARGPRLVHEVRASPWLLITLGVLGYAASGTLTSIALGLLPAGITSLMTNTSPLVLVIGGLAFFRQRIGRAEILGTLVGFGGVALLSLNDVQISGDLGATLLGSLLALGSATAWAVYTALARRLGGADPLSTTAITSGVGSLVIASVALPSQDWSRLMHASGPVLLATLWSGAVATGSTYAAWSFALKRLPAIAVAPFAYLIPVSALTISHFWLGERVDATVLLGAALVLAGVGLTQARAFVVMLRGRMVSA
jgi:drug/metabolite transporter (DMT)-like permease